MNTHNLENNIIFSYFFNLFINIHMYLRSFPITVQRYCNNIFLFPETCKKVGYVSFLKGGIECDAFFQIFSRIILIQNYCFGQNNK